MKSGANDPEAAPVLIGSTFPLSLIRRRVLVEPASLGALRSKLVGRPVASFWGHANTTAAATALVGVDLTPREARPALGLSVEGLPMLGGVVFDECWVVSPDYVPGYRPAIGEEVPPGKITGWQVLRIRWLDVAPKGGD